MRLCRMGELGSSLSPPTGLFLAALFFTVPKWRRERTGVWMGYVWSAQTMKPSVVKAGMKHASLLQLVQTLEPTCQVKQAPQKTTTPGKYPE